MIMSAETTVTAATLVNTLPSATLAAIFVKHGDEEYRSSRRIQ